jgi:hypothetical protein
MHLFIPFSTTPQSWSVGLGEGLTIENTPDSIAIYGQAFFESTPSSIERAQELLSVFILIQAQLSEDKPTNPSTLWTQNRAHRFTLGGNLELTRTQSRDVLSKTVAGLQHFIQSNALHSPPV